jgi:hypothetical protein
MMDKRFQDQAQGLRQLLHAAPPEVLAVLPCGQGSMNWVAGQLRARAASGARILAMEERSAYGNLADCLGISPRFDLAAAMRGELPLDACIHESVAGLDVTLVAALADALGKDRIFNQRCEAQLRVLRTGWDEWVVLARGGSIEGFSQLSLASPRFLVALSSDPMSLTAAYACLKQIAAAGGERLVSICMTDAEAPHARQTLQRLCDVVLQRLDMPLQPVSSVGEALACGRHEPGSGADAYIDRLVRAAAGGARQGLAAKG